MVDLAVRQRDEDLRDQGVWTLQIVQTRFIFPLLYGGKLILCVNISTVLVSDQAENCIGRWAKSLTCTVHVSGRFHPVGLPSIIIWNSISIQGSSSETTHWNFGWGKGSSPKWLKCLWSSKTQLSSRKHRRVYILGANLGLNSFAIEFLRQMTWTQSSNLM